MGAIENLSKLEIGADSGFVTCGLLTLEKFSELTGLPIGVCLGLVNRAYLPTVTLGRRRLVNLVVLQRELSKKQFALS